MASYGTMRVAATWQARLMVCLLCRAGCASQDVRSEAHRPNADPVQTQQRCQHEQELMDSQQQYPNSASIPLAKAKLTVVSSSARFFHSSSAAASLTNGRLALLIQQGQTHGCLIVRALAHG